MLKINESIIFMKRFVYKTMLIGFYAPSYIFLLHYIQALKNLLFFWFLKFIIETKSVLIIYDKHPTPSHILLLYISWFLKKSI